MKKKISTKKIIIILIIVLMSCAIYYMQQSSYLSFAYFHEVKDELLIWTQNNPWMSALTFLLFYVPITLFMPSAALLALCGGFLFGLVKALFLIMIGATISASITFLITRYLIGKSIQKNYASQLHLFNEELHHYGSYYLLLVRIIPLFPFFLVNMVAGLTKISLGTFAWTTAIGIIPSTLIYAFAGKEIGTVHSPRDILSPHLLIALALLGLFALIPVIIKKRKK